MNIKEKYKNDILSKLTPNDKFNQITAKLDLNDSFSSMGGNKNMKKRFVAITAGAVCCSLILGFGTYLLVDSLKPTEVDPNLAMVKMNLNPSITFIVNEKNEVVSVNGENNEGKMIVADENLTGKSLDEAIEIVLKIENETGYLVDGNATINDNNISFSITVDDEKLQSEIKSTIDKTVKDVCEDLNVYVSDKLTYVDAYNKEQLKSLVMEIDSTLTTEQVDAMTYEQMINIIKLHHIETAEIYSTELLELYNQSKEYEFKFAESKFTKELISDVDPIKELLIKETLAFYDLIMASLEEKVDALNDARFEHFIKEDSLYQKANDSILNSKLEVIKYKNQLAELDSENQDNKDEIQKMLDVQIKLLDDAMANLQTAKTNAEAFLTTIENTINDLMVQIETLKNEIISLLNIDFEAKLTEKAEELDIYLNETKTKFFTEFENKYKDEILKAKQDVLAYKEQLKQSTTTTN